MCTSTQSCFSAAHLHDLRQNLKWFHSVQFYSFSSHSPRNVEIKNSRRGFTFNPAYLSHIPAAFFIPAVEMNWAHCFIWNCKPDVLQLSTTLSYKIHGKRSPEPILHGFSHFISIRWPRQLVQSRNCWQHLNHSVQGEDIVLLQEKLCAVAFWNHCSLQERRNDIELVHYHFMVRKKRWACTWQPCIFHSRKYREQNVDTDQKLRQNSIIELLQAGWQKSEPL